MRAMVLHSICQLDRCQQPLVAENLPQPVPGKGEVLLQVLCCGVCHTELDIIEGRTPAKKLPLIPGHEVVARVVAHGDGASRFANGQRVGVGWIYCSDGTCNENVSPAFTATGRDVQGGYAEYMCVPEEYAYPVPDQFSDTEAAPLLCAGAIGYRALQLCGLQDGQVLGLTGFGGSGHIVLQLARHMFPASPVYVFARSADERAFAESLGAAWSGDTSAVPPAAPHAIIDTTPVWKPVLAALLVLRPGGRLVINAIRKQDDDRDCLSTLSYERHLWLEKEIKSVANITHQDIEDFLPIAAAADLHIETQSMPLEQANQALLALREGNIRGAYVLEIAQ
jgi:propanol-preferring alcohol dehydrogenase